VLATAVILSYNRQDVLRRQLLYYSNKPVHLIFADGSDADWGSGDSGSIGEMTWEYFRISGRHSYLKRMAEGCRRVKTDYMFRVDDEECILWTGVEKAITFLNQNPDHSCAGGRADSTSLSWRRLCLVPHYAKGRGMTLIQSEPLLRINSLSGLDRIRSIFYQVQRTSDVTRIADAAKDVVIEGRSPSFIEYLFDVSTILCGKYQSMEYPFWIRNGGSVPILPSEKVSIGGGDAALCARLILDAHSEILMRQSDFDLELFTQAILSCIMSISKPRKKSVISTKKTKVVKGRTFFTKKSTDFSHLLFDYIPKLYEILRPSGLKTFKRYAEVYGTDSRQVIEDALSIEEIWKMFPNGVSKTELKSLIKS